MQTLAKKFVCVTFLAVSALASAQEPAVTPTFKVGDPAPPLQVYKWIKGTPVAELKKGQIYVVEFWATWCAPCRKGMPHLTELAHHYKDKVTFLGLNIKERNVTKAEDYLPRVERFVERLGDGMDFTVGADSPDQDIAKAWMTASGNRGIPWSFIIGKDGTLLWHGFPPTGLDEALEVAVAGWNPEIAAKKIEEGQAMRAAALAHFNQSLRESDLEKKVQGCDVLHAAAPHSYHGVNSAKIKYVTLLKLDPKRAKDYAAEYMKIYDQSPLALQELGETILGQGPQAREIPPELRDYKTALDLLNLSYRRSDPQDPLLLTSVAEANFRAGDAAKAVEFQTQALQIAEALGAQTAPYKARLDEYSKK